MRLADGRTVRSDCTTLAHIKCGEYEDDVKFRIVPGNVGIILGYVWLREMNPEIDWKTSRISVRGGSGLV